LNKLPGILVIPLPRSIWVSRMQFSKALAPMLVTESGTVMDVIFCLSTNALAAIFVTGIPSTDSGMITAVSVPS
jgi:hypothetical protein